MRKNRKWFAVHVDSTPYRNVLRFFVCASQYKSGFEFHVTENSSVHKQTIQTN